MIEVWEPDMNENIYRDIYHTLYDYPYLSDESRNECAVMRVIDDLFNSPSSWGMEYPGGYFIFRGIGRGGADLFWIHNAGRLTRDHVRAAQDVLANASLSLHYITLKTADNGVKKIAEQMGFITDRVDENGFTWHGKKMPMTYMIKEKEN